MYQNMNKPPALLYMGLHHWLFLMRHLCSCNGTKRKLFKISLSISEQSQTYVYCVIVPLAEWCRGEDEIITNLWIINRQVQKVLKHHISALLPFSLMSKSHRVIRIMIKAILFDPKNERRLKSEVICEITSEYRQNKYIFFSSGEV